MSSNFSPTINEQLQAPELSQNDVLVRDAFVVEYLKDYNSYEAALRIGFHESKGVEWARNFLNCGYTLSRIKASEEKEKEKESFESDQQFVMNALKKEACYSGPGASHAARITALGLMGKMLGMDVKAPADAGTNNGGVMLVPAMTDATSWGAGALDSQQLLKQSVRE